MNDVKFLGNPVHLNAKWIKAAGKQKDVCPEFTKSFSCDGTVRSATLRITALGVYEALINGKRIGEFFMAPGWTAYQKRLQVQTYDITPLLTAGENTLFVTVGKGWYSSPMPGWTGNDPDKIARNNRDTGLIAELVIEFADGTVKKIATDESWQWKESRVRFSELYDGEIYDASFVAGEKYDVACFDGPDETLIMQEGEEIREIERFTAKEIIHTPKGETVIDFGQEISGYVEFTLNAKKGDEVEILHGEVLDKRGNFYNENYRAAKAVLRYTCKDGQQTYKPHLTFYGFRYIKLDSFPCEPKAGQFTAIAVSSLEKQTGFIKAGHEGINRLISNILWGQKDNFVDVPTDCPQRDERLGWLGDAQVFIKAAALNFDVERFFKKWFRDMRAEQRKDGSLGSVVPDYLPNNSPSAGWSDAAVICPWVVFQAYGNREMLSEQFESMKKWVDYIGSVTKKKYLWKGGNHYGDWLGLDAKRGSYKGASRDDFIASAYYYYSTTLLIKAGKVLGKSMDEYEQLQTKIRNRFNSVYKKYKTQTEYAVALYFGLAPDKEKAAKELADRVIKDGTQLKTGFIGTPYILHALTDNGYTELSYDLLLREDYPSWLFPVKMGATTVWEHWDGINEKGDFWSADMNSFNHYAYGAVIDWIYEKAAGIRHGESLPAYEKAIIEPHPDRRLGCLDVSLETRNGIITSRWEYTGDKIKYEISADMPVTVIIDRNQYELAPGKYTF